MAQERKFIFLGQHGYYDLIAQCGIELDKCPVYKALFSLVNNGKAPLRINVTVNSCNFPTTIKVKPTTGQNLTVKDTTYDAADGSTISQNQITAHLPDNVTIDKVYDLENKCLMCILNQGNEK